MPITPPALPGAFPTTRLRAAVLAVALLLSLGLPLSVSGAGATAQPAPAGNAAPPTSPAGNRTDAEARVTLLTGDVVAWHRSPSGTQAASVVEPAAKDSRPPLVYEQDGQVHVVPAEALPYVQSGVLDKNLFNITLLVRSQLDDRSTAVVPLLLQGRGGAETRRAPATPDEATRVRTLTSVGMVAVDGPKDQVRDVWTSLRGRQADLTASDARLDGAAQVWLNGRVQATLEDSVPQIGAPEAWAEGYDGTGATVAVLDTGYDPGHPDLAGQVVGVKDFTGTSAAAIDDNGHGTHVAATVAGTGEGSNLGEGTGVAPGAALLVGKVLDASGSASLDQVIAGMEWAAHNGADVVNLSLGTPYPTDGSDPTSQAVDRLSQETGTLFVVAAGNTGPDEGTIGSPGAAATALTVGAVDKQDAPATFSSRGPRIGKDRLLKPEIVAPGVDIIAARAAGTSLGIVLDERYTSMNGTSMATPHVAGAATILAAQHPSWDHDELKARLVSTSEALADVPVTTQGAGRADVADAVADSVSVDTAVLSLGRVPQDSPAVAHTVTYDNPTDRPIRLRLSADVSGTGSRSREQAEIEVSEQVLTVPAGGAARTKIRLLPRQTEDGPYAGRIIARELGRDGAELHTVVSVVVDGPLRTLTVNGTDRNGAPARGTIDLWSAETGDYRRILFQDGTVSENVPEGLYTVISVLEPADGEDWFPYEQTVAVDPQVRVKGDVTLDFDARDGAPVRLETPRPADALGYEAFGRRTVGQRSVWFLAAQGFGGSDLFVVPSPTASIGTFHFGTQWQLAQPRLTARVAGPEGFAITPNPRYSSPGDAYAGEGSLPVVYAGAGTAADYEGVNAEGKVALVARQDPDSEQAQAQAAKDAGAAVLLVHNTQSEKGHWAPELWGVGQPTYTITEEAGRQLRSALASDAALRLDVKGVRDLEYVYELVFQDDRVPRNVDYKIGAEDVATVRSDYRKHDAPPGAESWIPELDEIGTGQSMSLRRNGPVVRTEYVTAGDHVRWGRFAQPHHEFPGSYWVWSAYEPYQAGQTYEQQWWGPVVHPAVLTGYGPETLGSPVARYRDAIRVMMPHYWFGGSRRGDIDHRFGDVSELTLSRDGHLIGTAEWPRAQFTVPESDAEYELRLRTQHGASNYLDLSSSTDTTWTFRSRREGEGRTVLPLVQLHYDLETDGYNQADASSSYPLQITTGYQPGVDRQGEFEVSVEVSYDDGETWLEAPTEGAGRDWRAQIPAAPAGSRFATVRVIAEDEAGNSLDQRVTRAWKVAADQR